MQDAHGIGNAGLVFERQIGYDNKAWSNPEYENRA